MFQLQEADDSKWIAARFEKNLPEKFLLGSMSRTGTEPDVYFNKKLRSNKIYRVFIRATTFTVSCKYSLILTALLQH